jgi:hypothetical protein
MPEQQDHYIGEVYSNPDSGGVTTSFDDERDLLLHQPPNRRDGEVLCAGRRDRGVPVPGHQDVALLRALTPDTQQRS